MGLLLRLALLGLLGLIIYRFLQRTFGLQISRQPPRDPETAAPQAMRRCAYCKVHVPEGESTQSRGHFFCSEKHRDAFLREQR
jgi:uncharacterized protein